MIDEAARTVSIPAELGLVPAAELEFADPDAVTTIIGMSPTSSTLGVIINTRPNTFGYGLDQLVGSELDWQLTRIDDRDARVATTPGGSRQVAWLDDDMYVTAVSATTVTDDELLEIVRGVRFTDADEFRAIVATNAAQEQADLISWDVFGRTTTPDGLDVTVRSRPGSSGANAICLETSDPACATLISETGAIDGFETYGSAGFTVEGAMIGTVRVSNDPEIDRANQLQRPAESTSISVRPSDFLNSADGDIDGTTANIVVDTQTDQGRFVIAAFPATERPPTIQFFGAAGDDVPAATAFELTPGFEGRRRRPACPAGTRTSWSGRCGRPACPGGSLDSEGCQKFLCRNRAGICPCQLTARTTAWPSRTSFAIDRFSLRLAPTPTTSCWPSAVARRSSESSDGRAPPPSIRAIADCVVPIRCASSACVRPASVRSVNTNSRNSVIRASSSTATRAASVSGRRIADQLVRVLMIRLLPFRVRSCTSPWPAVPARPLAARSAATSRTPSAR